MGKKAADNHLLTAFFYKLLFANGLLLRPI